MNTRLIWITPDAEKHIAYCARVSNPANQENENISRLLKYCIMHRHWSPFEMASMCIEIETSRAIGTQILRHRSFSFQEFSQRYADASQLGVEPVELRRQSQKNRQSSEEIFNPELYHGYVTGKQAVENQIKKNIELYNDLLAAGVAKEVARMILPLTVKTRMYMTGTIRSWIHYLDLRCEPDVQKEHRDLALSIRDTIFVPNLPIISEAVGWPQP